MIFKEISVILKDIPFMSTQDGKIIYNFVIRSGFQKILELGFAHGTSTCYLAAALDEIGRGSIITIDNQFAKERKPNIFTLLNTTNLNNYVKPIFADTSYTWELMKIIEQYTIDGICNPVFDFCFIDGAHTWEVDGLAFFLVEKLLKPGGWILFDDLSWTFAKSPTLRNTKWVKKMPEDQKTIPQIEKVFSLLVKQHQNFENIKIFKEWGWAQKSPAENRIGVRSKRIIKKIHTRNIIKSNISELLKKIRNFIHS